LQPVAHSYRKERKNKMTNQAISHDLRNPCGKGYERGNTWQRNSSANQDKKADCQKRASIWEILFTPPWRRNDGGHAGAEMQPFVVNMPGGSYTVTDNHRSLAAAAHAGPVSTMAEVWQNTAR
jgi:hypothetical protein